MVMLVSPQRRQQGSAQVRDACSVVVSGLKLIALVILKANGVSAWTSQMKGRFSAFALVSLLVLFWGFFLRNSDQFSLSACGCAVATCPGP